MELLATIPPMVWGAAMVWAGAIVWGWPFVGCVGIAEQRSQIGRLGDQVLAAGGGSRLDLRQRCAGASGEPAPWGI